MLRQRVCGHGDNRQCLSAVLHLPDLRGCLIAIHTRHFTVHQNKITTGWITLQQRQRLFGRTNYAGRHIQLAQHGPYNHLIHRVVFDHQNPQTAQIRLRCLIRVDGAIRQWQPDGKTEARTTTELAVHFYNTTHQLNQLLGNGQAQPGAAVFAGGGAVGLLEGLEQPALLVRREADAGVVHRHAQARPAAIGQHAPRLQAHAAAFGELDRVVGVVDQDLPQAQRIAEQRQCRLRRRPPQWQAARSTPSYPADCPQSACPRSQNAQCRG